MNIDFGLDPVFSTYVLLLIGSGVAMLLMAGAARTSRGLRIANAVFGLGFFLYGLYLGFLFEGGGYLIFFKAFILPVVMVVKTVGSLVRRTQQAPGVAAAPTAPGAPEAPVAPGGPW